MSKQVENHIIDVQPDEQGSAPERTQDDYDRAFTEIVTHAEELGLTPEETDAALADYATMQESGETSISPEGEDGKDALSLEDVIADPNKLMEHLDTSGGNPFEGMEKSLSKLTDDVDGLAESMRGMGEMLNKLMEMLQELVKLLKEIIEMAAKRDVLETQAEKDEMTREIQKKVDEFGYKYGG